jgi:hypothetical protein
MLITRRRLMASASAALAATGLPRRGWTQTTLTMGDRKSTRLNSSHEGS